MTIKEFKDKLDKLPFSREDYYVISGGSLLLHGIRKETDDIDICLDQNLFETLTKNNSLRLSNKENICPIYLYNGEIECIFKSREDFDCTTTTDGYQTESLTSILAFKIRRGLEKDLNDINKIKNYLNSNNDNKKLTKK